VPFFFQPTHRLIALLPHEALHGVQVHGPATRDREPGLPPSLHPAHTARQPAWSPHRTAAAAAAAVSWVLDPDLIISACHISLAPLLAAENPWASPWLRRARLWSEPPRQGPATQRKVVGIALLYDVFAVMTRELSDAENDLNPPRIPSELGGEAAWKRLTDASALPGTGREEEAADTAIAGRC